MKSFTYDKANQLVTSTTDNKVTKYAYDAAGRLVKEGNKTYSYGYLDKILEVQENGEQIAAFDYHIDGQVAQATHGDKTENFLWDGLALIHRGDNSFVNEPYVTGGNPILSSKDGVMFNDMLGTTLGVAENGKFTTTPKTAFGQPTTSQPNNSTTETDKVGFFTGKPYIGELGYAFLFRNYRADQGKWQTKDPLGYPDGWNQFAYVNNAVTFKIDLLGLSELSAAQYRQFIESRLNAGITNVDILFKDTLNHYLENDPEDDLIWDAEDDMEEIIEAFYDIFSDSNSPYNHGAEIAAGIHTGDGSGVTHFFAGAAYEGAFEFGDSAQDIFEWLGGQSGDWLSDTAYAYAGADFSDYFDTWTEAECRRRIKEFTSGKKTLTGLLGENVPTNTEQGVRDFRNQFRRNLAE